MNSSNRATSQEKAGGHTPAFPACYQHKNGGDYTTSEQHGLTKREYFAAMAMQSLLLDSGWFKEVAEDADVAMAELAISSCLLADALLARLGESEVGR